MILAMGFCVRSIRGVQFRQWANRNLTEYLRKGLVIDYGRLKKNGRLSRLFRRIIGSHSGYIDFRKAILSEGARSVCIEQRL